MSRRQFLYRFGDAATFILLMLVLLYAPGMFL